MDERGDDGGTDDDLIARINAGDAAAFADLYFRYRDWAHRLARRFTGHDDDALDVLQETFSYLHRKRPLVRTAKMTTFLWPVVRHLSLQARRKRTRSLAVGDAALDTLSGGEGPAIDEGLRDVLARLSAEHRQVVLMRFADDLSLAEIAELTGVPLGTVKSRLHHAIAALRDDPRTRSLLT